MSNATSVFICYKKVLTSQNEKGEVIRHDDSRAEILHEILDSRPEYTAWRDESDLAAGIEWEKEIYTRLASCDVVLVLISAGTSASEWVKREIALAQAFGISILPLGYSISADEMADEVEKLGIAKLQYTITSNIQLRQRDALVTELGPSLALGKSRTQASRKALLDRLVAAGRIVRTPAESNQRAASFVFGSDERHCSIHIAAGDVAKLRDIDVFVNSENNYMQMARFFERRTVSSLLRHSGSRIVRGGVFEDTIQQELDWQLRDHARPVPATAVVATSAGAPGSVLTDWNRARYIFHVAAVQAVDAENRVIPYKQPYQIEACVKNSLAKISELRSARGVISPPQTDQRTRQETRANDFAIRSLVLPLFATGDGGAAAVEVIHPMITGLREFLTDRDYVDVVRDLQHIYISVFLEDDVRVVANALGEAFAA